MPPITPVSSGIISEASKRGLERQYHPTQPLEPHQYQNQPGPLTGQMSPNGHGAFPTPTTTGTLQESRNLPAVEVTDENFDDAYVDFIMYCNPSVALETDTTELKKIFRTPPKSDGKSFSTFTLFQLIQKLERKELKTWAQLAIELGVEPPSLEKGQSAQKVQQYAVRLKVREISS